MREVELKFKVNSLDTIINRLKKEGCIISSIEEQYDTIYVKDLNRTESNEGSVWLRVRKTNETIELNYKKQSAKKFDSQEIEFQVDSYEKANNFLKAIGFQEWVQVHKKRRYTNYQGYNICLDEVDKLGFFIEIELLVDENDEKNYEENLLQIAEKFGIKNENRVNSHYDTMISELKA